MNLEVIVNPKAGGGRAARRIPEIERSLADHGIRFQLRMTEGPRDATRLAREARARAPDAIAIVGGDGTVNEVVRSYIDDAGQLNPGPPIALIPAGTGGDFRKTFGLEDSVGPAIARLATAKAKPLDLGVVELTRHDGATAIHAFANIMSFGLGGLTDRLVNRSPKWLGGRAAFLLGSLRATLAYKNLTVDLRVDGKPCLQMPIVNVALCNGRYFGGGMMIAPEADPSDGLLDVIAICDLTRAQGIGLGLHLYRGSHVGRPGVTVTRGAVIEALPLRNRDEVLIDLDGETPGRLPLRARLIPGGLSIMA